MNNKKGLGDINAEIGILEVQKELMESKEWDDKEHLERKYKMHLNNFDGVVRYLCNSVGLSRVQDQNGEHQRFDISRDYSKSRGEDKLISYIEFNDKTKANSLLLYSPTKGVAFEYSASLLPKNVQLGKRDFFGKTIENMVRNVASATEDIKFHVRFDRYGKEPKGIKEFAIYTEDFVAKEKQGDVISIISFMDSIVKGIRNPVPWASGPNFVHEKSGPLFNIGMTITID